MSEISCLGKKHETTFVTQVVLKMQKWISGVYLGAYIEEARKLFHVLG